MRRWILWGALRSDDASCQRGQTTDRGPTGADSTAAAAAHKPDAEIVRLISGIALSERFGEATHDRLDKRLNAGPQVALALHLLADQSAFLDLPASELPDTAVPDEAAQLQMFDAGARYVVETLARQPNFLATRTNNRYNDRPQELKQGAWSVRAGLHLMDQSSRVIARSSHGASHRDIKEGAIQFIPADWQIIRKDKAVEYATRTPQNPQPPPI